MTDGEDGADADVLTAPLVIEYPFSRTTGPVVGAFGAALGGGFAFPFLLTGVLTQGALLAVLAKPNQTSPIHRGKFVREQLLCESIPPPPDGIPLIPPDPDPSPAEEPMR